MTKQRVLVTNVYDRLCFFLEDDGKITEILVSDEDDKNGASVQVGDIYIGRIKRRIPNIHAVFIELFPGMECYCTEEETACAYFTKKNGKQKVCVGDELVVQVNKEASKSKKPSVTTNISLTGRYAVISMRPHEPGVSSKLPKKERETLKNWLKDLATSSCGVILRTEAAKLPKEELSKEIRTPLTSILSNSQYLASKEALTPEETAAYIALVQSKAEQIRLLTDQLLGKAESENRLVENAALLLQQLAFQWEETLEDSFLCQVDLSGCQPFKAEVELSALQRIFDNLASNVEKYADPSQPVVLRLSCGQGEVQIFQQNAVTPNPEKPKDSHGIGLKSINEIAKNTGGYADFSLNPASFEIRILLKLKSCL